MIARSDNGAAEKTTGSERYSAPAGTIISGLPEKVSALSVAGTICAEAVETGRAMWTEVKCSGAVPKRLDMWTRNSVPPIDR